MVLAALFSLVRPLNLLLAGFAILLGARAAGASIDANPSIGSAIAAALLVLAGGYAWNDAADVARDRVAHPDRPLPRGVVTARAARGVALVLFALGLAVALLGPVNGASRAAAAAPSSPGAAPRALLVLWTLLLLAYRPIADLAPIAKNLVAGTLTASALLLGGLLGPSPARALFPACFALLLSWIRETVKDLADRDGDRATGRPTWIDSVAGTTARGIVQSAIVALLVAIPAPALFLGYRPAYLLLAAAGVGTVLVLVYRDLDRLLPGASTRGAAGAAGDALAPEPPAAAGLRRASRLLKAGMAAGLVALFAGAPR